jgi:hypothetical protein
MFDALLSQLEVDLLATFGTCVTKLVVQARGRLEIAHADIANERAHGLSEVSNVLAKALAEVAEERAEALAEVDADVPSLDVRSLPCTSTRRRKKDVSSSISVAIASRRPCRHFVVFHTPSSMPISAADTRRT